MRITGLALALSSVMFVSTGLPQDAVAGYAVDSDGTDHLHVIDLLSGTAADLGAVGFGGVEGLAFGPDGRLYGIDEETDTLITLDTGTGMGEAIGPLGVDVTDAGLTFDGNGNLFVVSAIPEELFEVNRETGAATSRGDLGRPLTALTTVGMTIYGIGCCGFSDFYRLDTDKASGETIGELGLDIGDGGLASDLNGTIWAINDTGEIFTIDPFKGGATMVGMTSITGIDGLAIPTRQICGYSVDSSTGDFYSIEMLTGNAVRVGPVGFSDVNALAWGPMGVLYGVDDDTDSLITIDLATGEGTLVGSLGIVDAGYGLGTSSGGDFFLGTESGAFYSVDPVTGAATVINASGRSITGLVSSASTSEDGQTIWGLGVVPASLESIDTSTGMSTQIGLLMNVSPGGAGLDEGPDGILWGIESNGQIFIVSATTGSAVAVATTRIGFESLVVAECVNGPGALLVDKAQFQMDFQSAGNDRFDVDGSINPRTLPDDLSGVEVRLLVDGQEVGPIATLDEKGRFRSASGASEDLSVRLDEDGDLKYKLKGTDLSGIFDVPNEEGQAILISEIAVGVRPVGGEEQVFSSRVPLDVDSKAEKKAKGQFRFGKQEPLTGVFTLDRLQVREEEGGEHEVSIRGEFASNGGGPIFIEDDPMSNGDVIITIGDPDTAEPIEIPLTSLEVMSKNGVPSYQYSSKLGPVPRLEKFSFDNSKNTFQIQTTAIDDTGIPLAGTGEPTTFLLPVEITIHTIGGVEMFRSVAEIARKDELQTKWDL